MKKLLCSKKIIPENATHRVGPSRRPNRTVSNWEMRNDSSNVCAVLHPDRYVEKPIKLQSKSDKTMHKAPKGAYKKCWPGGNTCYCTEKRIRPRLMPRLQRVKVQDDPAPNALRASLTDCNCKGDYLAPPNSSASDLFRRHEDELSNIGTRLSYTESRNEYEDFHDAQQRDYMNEVVEYLNDEQRREDEKVEGLAVSTIMGTKEDASRAGSSFISHSQSTADLNKFRDDHYFETHSTEEFSRDVPDHTCIHQFKLDDRLLPQPLSVDEYGRSRCQICSQPMEGDKMQLAKSYFNDRPSRKNLKHFSKWYELGLVPRSVNIGGEKATLQLDLRGKERGKFGAFIGSYKRPEYFNTYALRQQKLLC